MKRRIPKKNVSEDVSDIKRPGDRSEGFLAADGWMDKNAVSHFRRNENMGESVFAVKPKKENGARKFLYAAVFLCGTVLFVLGVGVYSKWSALVDYFNSSSGKVGDFLGKDNDDAGRKNSAAGKLTLFDLAKTKELWGNAGSMYSGFQDFSAAGVGLVEEADIFQKNWASFVFEGRGQEFIDNLRKTKEYLGSMEKANAKLSAFNVGLGDFLFRQYGSALSFQLNFQRIDNFLGALINWLSLPDDRHMLVLFENSSEMRPGGGFIGSYADVTFSGGSVKSVNVHDINEPGRTFLVNIIPPKQLQAAEKSWSIADSNWFLDYQMSAMKTMQLMERSKMYQNVSFDGAVAVLPGAIKDILGLTGPIELPARGMVINKDNFLTEIQGEVQDAQAQGQPSKKIISELVPKIISKLSSLDADGGTLLMRRLADRIAKRDIVAYSKDSDIQNFIDFYGASGKVFQPPSDFNGNYLAVPSANIGGGKSDLFVRQKVFLRTQLNSDGTASNHLEISRTHNAGKSDAWWYKLPNESYVQMFVPQDASISGFSGGSNKKITPKADYASGYSVDPLVSNIESSLTVNFDYPLLDEFRESGKKVFGAWMRTEAGQTSAVSMDYSTHLFLTPAVGQKYQMVFEKQAGATGDYSFEIYAPIGFVWGESNSPVFEYNTSDPDGRTVITLTLENQKN